MKILITWALAFFTLYGRGQENVQTSNAFIVSGEVKKTLTFTIEDLSKMPATKIGDFTITNHKGEVKSKGKNLSGILLKDILSGLEFNSDQPKLLSEYFLTLIASDNYKVVYSWNEIFNTPTGNGIYIIVGKDGKTLAEMEDRILVVSVTDFATGRRNLKSLVKIQVNRTN